MCYGLQCRSQNVDIACTSRLVISKFPAYQDVKKLGTERPGALFLDLGCCFGNDIRMLVSEGFPPEQCVASDIKPGMHDKVSRDDLRLRSPSDRTKIL